MSSKKLGFWSVWALGVGGIVGGLFPALGVAIQIADAGAPLAFVIAGTIALITTYAYAKLSVAHPCRGGTVTFLNQAFSQGLFSGTLNLLLWFSYVVMLSFYLQAFASYGVNLFAESTKPIWKHLLINLAILGTTGLNLLAVKYIGKSQIWIVGFKLGILILFITMGINHIDISHVQTVSVSSVPSIFIGAMVIFLSYEGFELIANTAEDIVNPNQTLPRIYYSVIGFVILLYILIALVTLGAEPIEQILAAKEYALAEVAKPIMGRFGSFLVTIAALLSTISASNATLYGSARFSSIIAKSRGFNSGNKINGLFLTSGITLFIANFFDVNRISTMGSAGFLLIFAAVNLANARLHLYTKSKQWVSLLGAGICLVALGILIYFAVQTDPQTVWVFIFMLGVAIGIEIIYYLSKKRCNT
ncbi:APC family permease [Aetokthonos hydrillicola Thurmond2011]|uniref:APC family permease n=1 Tax=Aetokthonos hydrillicola Thurmond2011 TaxID=2712845 RepID=A0AAP5III3_9CYAN|nr:APC family permease [Aetokthonos hydrillicola]MBO3461706.1 amino acid permease [Aetokthonos hydrillicola CCALA 1050]MBW4589988.1 APC family permease [Aetokthonos hydrillicola CCALA 1050]MDR9900570.1 APC family permease [Aetokthonos hydrillicola Thurmond2011]